MLHMTIDKVNKLSDLATFRICHAMWSTQNVMNKPLVNVTWDVQTKRLMEDVTEVFQNMPRSVHTKIKDGITKISKEIAEFSKLRYSTSIDEDEPIFKIHASQLVWTSSFTIDRIESLHSVSNVTNDTILEGYVCSPWVLFLWNSETNELKNTLSQKFGKQRILVYLYWVHYMKVLYTLNQLYNYTSGQDYYTMNDSSRFRFAHRNNNNNNNRHYNPSSTRRNIIMLEDHITNFGVHYLHSSSAENVFRFVVLSGVINKIPACLSSIPSALRVSNITMMISVLFDQSHHLKYNDDIVSNTLLCLWRELRLVDRIQLVQRDFYKFLKFVIKFPYIEELIPYIHYYNPVMDNPREHRRFLGEAISGIKLGSDTYESRRTIFLTIYLRVKSLISDIDVVNLLEKILIIKDIETAVVMVAMLENGKKNVVLDAINSIWNDIWKESVDAEIFMKFFFEVQSTILGFSPMIDILINTI